MSSFIFAGKTRYAQSRYREPVKGNSKRCINCAGTFSLKTLNCYDGKRCSRCFDKHQTKNGGLYKTKDIEPLAHVGKFGFYTQGKDLLKVHGSIAIESSEDESDREFITDSETNSGSDNNIYDGDNLTTLEDKLKTTSG